MNNHQGDINLFEVNERQSQHFNVTSHFVVAISVLVVVVVVVVGVCSISIDVVAAIFFSKLWYYSRPFEFCFEINEVENANFLFCLFASFYFFRCRRRLLLVLVSIFLG